MEFAQASARFHFLSHALNGTGGFAPVVKWERDSASGKESATLQGPSYLVRYARESDEKFGGRNALALYENHLRTACERYTGFLGRKQPHREGIDGPLTRLLLENADLRGNGLDDFWRAFALEARARGSMLLVIDKLNASAPVNSLADQIRARQVPYLQAAEPERLVGYEVDQATGLFAWARLSDTYKVDGKPESVVREYTATGWRVLHGQRVVDQGEHGFGVCPVIPFTENGQAFPVVGKFAQVADLSRRIFNARSELDEILRGSTFPLLTLQVPPEQAQTFDAGAVSATVGTHSMLVHGGEKPDFIAPPNGPAEVYMKTIDGLQAAISRITCEDILSGSKQLAAESGVSRKLRFEGLNADLATFAKQLQSLERLVWALFDRATSGGAPEATCAWPTDYNLADVAGELDILALMQDTGFPAEVLAEKRKSIVATEFDNADDDTKAALLAAIDEAAQREARAPDDPGGSTDPNDDPAA